MGRPLCHPYAEFGASIAVSVGSGGAAEAPTLIDTCAPHGGRKAKRYRQQMLLHFSLLLSLLANETCVRLLRQMRNDGVKTEDVVCGLIFGGRRWL